MSLFMLFLPAFGYLETPKHCKTMGKCKMTNRPFLPPHRGVAHTRWEVQCLSAMVPWHPDRHASATSPSFLRDDQNLRDNHVTVQWRRAGCSLRASPYRHPGYHANVVPGLRSPPLKNARFGLVSCPPSLGKGAPRASSRWQIAFLTVKNPKAAKCTKQWG